MINTKHFDPTLLKIDKKSFKGIGIYNIGYITTKKIDGCKNTHSVNPLYLLIDHANEYIEKEFANKYFFFDCTDESDELLKKYNDFWSGIKKIEEVSGNKYDYKNIT